MLTRLTNYDSESGTLTITIKNVTVHQVEKVVIPFLTDFELEFETPMDVRFRRTTLDRWSNDVRLVEDSVWDEFAQS